MPRMRPERRRSGGGSAPNNGFFLLCGVLPGQAAESGEPRTASRSSRISRSIFLDGNSA